MDLNEIKEMKSQNGGATGYYNNREIYIRKIYDDTGLVEVVDLANGDMYSLHTSKIGKSDNNLSNSLY